jgi:hypothetical protein
MHVHITFECIGFEFCDIILWNEFEHIGTNDLYAAFG